ncbi:transposase family protein [Streptomyces sp. NPDC059590]|uniref:transposase family protein n=1 Tax=Streptomyces sp. NPDC059590 TaxID=3346877 RepID=UPI0036AFB30E
MLIDGTLIPTRRRTGKDNRKNYSGKHKRHGLHFLALTDERGRLIWISAARPGRTHDITAARHDHIVEHLKAADLAPVEHGFAHLKTWRILTKLRTNPRPRHQPAPRPARPDEPRTRPLTDDQDRRQPPTTSTSTHEPRHISSRTSENQDGGSSVKIRLDLGQSMPSTMRKSRSTPSERATSASW